MIKRLQITFLVFVPLVFLIIGFKFDRTKFGTDPESAYLLNGLNIAMGRSVGHYDNPGTTVQMYSAVVIRVTHLFRSAGNDLQTDVLANSEYYIEILRYSLIVMNACILLMLGVVALLLLENFWAGLLLQLAPFLSVTLIEECYTKVAPEPLLFATIAVLIMLLLKFYTSIGPAKVKFALWFGLLAGFGLATKMTFLPVLIVPVIVLNGRRNKWIYIASILPSFILFTLPAATGYLHMANWFLNLGTHTGTYGAGNSGIIDTSKYFGSLISIAINNKALIIVMLLAVVLLVLLRFAGQKPKTVKSKEFRILLAIVLAQAGSILMVAKHYHSNHYLFPALSLSGFVIVLIFALLKSKASGKWRRVLEFSMPAAVAAVIGITLLNIPFLTQAYKGYRLSNQSTNETVSILDRDYKGFAKVYYYPVSFNEYSSLRWGNVYSRQYSTQKLTELFPLGLFYNAWDKTFQLWETNIPVTEFVKKYGGRILLVGGPRTPEEYAVVEQGGLKLKKLFDSRVQVVYEIDTANSILFKDAVQAGPRLSTLKSDFETFSADGKWILSDKGTPLCRKEALDASRTRSGTNSIKLAGMDCYGMEYEVTDVRPGDRYEVVIWQQGGSRDVFLVASAGSADPFYVQSKGNVDMDSKGWKKVMLNFKMPPSFKGDKIKIYLWNHGNSPVWYDDFQLTRY